ncbi:MAG: hypothetical protein ACRD8A_14890 [Candidatus Acidiferrales bacterium]
MLEQFWRDIGLALRVLRKERGFAATAIIILALGIGAQTAVFSLVNGILLRPQKFMSTGAFCCLL